MVVEASKGQQIALGAGSEAIVRSGEATAISVYMEDLLM